MNDDKILFIYKNINLINHNNIIDYIKLNNIKYTNNNNGFFINISCLNSDHINNIYTMIIYYINNKNENDIFIDKRKQLILENLHIVKNNKKTYNIDMEDFTEDDKHIIRQSKLFNINLI